MDKAIFRTHKTKKASKSIIFYLPQRTEVIAFTIADAIPLLNTILLKLQLRLSIHSVASAINKSNQKHPNKQIKK
jgi:hypothetical protein